MTRSMIGSQLRTENLERCLSVHQARFFCKFSIQPNRKVYSVGTRNHKIYRSNRPVPTLEVRMSPPVLMYLEGALHHTARDSFKRHTVANGAANGIIQTAGILLMVRSFLLTSFILHRCETFPASSHSYKCP